MGYIRHDAIVVTCGSSERASEACALAIEIGLQVTDIVTSKVNGYCSFLIVPDGSKEGWHDSEVGDERRAKWKQRAAEGVDWAHVSFGGDEENRSHLVDHN